MSEIEAEIEALEARLKDARARLQNTKATSDIVNESATPRAEPLSSKYHRHITQPPSDLHNLFLLSDSALPLGSFAFSAGLESFLAHRPKHSHTSAAFSRFLTLSLASIASTTLPYVIAGHEHPSQLLDLDNDLDASTSCVVAKRASVRQGRALLGVWERSFRQHISREAHLVTNEAAEARTALEAFTTALKAQPPEIGMHAHDFPLHGHLPPLFGTTCAALSIPLMHALYVYLFNHAKTIISAAIRASISGPYQAQGVLASEFLRSKIWALVVEEVGLDGAKERRGREDAGQSVPVLDLWGGRHEIVYSRIFNS